MAHPWLDQFGTYGDDIRESAVVEGAIEYKVITPGCTFFNIIGPISDSPTFCVTSCRDDSNESVARALFRSARSVCGGIEDVSDLFARGVMPENDRGFQTSVFIGGNLHRAFETWNPLLNSHTVFAYPVYDCEILPEWNWNQISGRARRGLILVDWYRQKFPIVYGRGRNDRMQIVGSRWEEWTYSSALFYCRELLGASGFVQLKNFQGGVVTLETPNSRYIAVSEKGESVDLTEREIESWLRHFLTEGE